MRNKKFVYHVILAIFFIAQFQFIGLLNLPTITIPGTQVRVNPDRFSLLNPPGVDSAGLSSASATLSNPRLSFLGGTAGIIAVGTNVITLSTTATTWGDINTNNLFPNDNVAIAVNGINGSIPVASISSSTVFTLRNNIGVAAGANTNIYATQSGTLTMNFYTSAAIPTNGYVLVSIPASNGAKSGGPNDNAPDTTSATNSNGFDLNGMTTANVTCPNGSFTMTSVTAGAGGIGAPHLIKCTYTGAGLAAGANLTVVIGTGTKPLINPAPINTGHTQGLADIYVINVATKDSSDNLLESIDTRAAPVEGVLVSAQVDETLSFQIAGVAAGASTYCGKAHTAGITTTATSVPWGTINSSYSVDKNEAVQQLTVTTNAPTGYTVYASENDQMGKDGNACTGSTPNPFEYLFSGNTCIRDANCGGGAYSTCTHTLTGEWGTTPNGNGFGFSLQNQSGTDATFLYNTGGVYMARQFADLEAASSAASLMTNSGPVSGSSAYVCYRINIPSSQPAGYYYSKLRYTAVAKF